MISSSCLAEVQRPHQLRSSAPRKAKSVSTAKVLRERIKRTDDKRLPRFLDCRKWKSTARPQTALRNYDGPGAARFRDGRTTARPLKLRRGPTAPAATRGHEPLTQKALKLTSRKICPNGFEQETRGKHTELKRKLSERAPLSAKRAPGRNRARDHPLQRRTRDHRATSPAAGPRRARGSAAAKRARPRKRANLARGKICDFSPELGFEQQNRFRSLRDTRRTEKKVLRKPPAARPVVGQTFKYIY